MSHVLVDYCTLYTDGAGNHDWYRPYGHSNTRFYTVAGVILDAESDLRCKKEIDDLLQSHIPKESLEIRPYTEYELHLSHIVSRKGIYRKLTQDQREEILDKAFKIIFDLHPTIVASTVDKLEFMNHQHDKSFMVRSFTLLSIMHKFSSYLKRHNAIGSIVYDDDHFKFRSFMQDEISRIRKNGIHISETANLSVPDKMEHVLNNVNFCPSYLSTGIQIADLIAGVIWKKYEKNDTKYYELLDPLWEQDAAGKIFADTMFEG